MRRGRETLLGDYAASNTAEFFATASERFFTRPAKLRHDHPGLYDELAAPYAVDPREWQASLGRGGAFAIPLLRYLEQTFGPHQKPENHWHFHYYRVHDGAGRLLLASFFTLAWMKDDMFAASAVSRTVEARRRDEPSYLTSRVVTMGSPLSEGHALFLDRAGDWRGSLQLLVARVSELAQSAGASSREPVHAVVVLDNSRSMGARLLGGTLLDAAKQRAATALGTLPRGSRVTVLPLCGPEGSYTLDAHLHLDELLGRHVAEDLRDPDDVPGLIEHRRRGDRGLEHAAILAPVAQLVGRDPLTSADHGEHLLDALVRAVGDQHRRGLAAHLLARVSEQLRGGLVPGLDHAERREPDHRVVG